MSVVEWKMEKPPVKTQNVGWNRTFQHLPNAFVTILHSSLALILIYKIFCISLNICIYIYI